MFDSLNSLPNLTKIDVVIRGGWNSPDEPNRTWGGGAAAELPIVGTLFLSLNERLYWTKSVQITDPLGIAITLHPLRDELRIQLMCYIGGFSANHDTTTTFHSKDYLPEIPAVRTVKTSQVFRFAHFDSTPPVDVDVIFFAKQDIKVARGHIWGLRNTLRTGLTSPLLEVFTYGRKGMIRL